MHGTEHREQKHRTHSLFVPRPPDFPGAGSTRRSAPRLLSCSGPVARIGLSLARNSLRICRSPFQGQCSRPDASRPCQLLPLPVRLPALLPIPVGPEIGGFVALARCSFLNRHGLPPDPASTPLREYYLPRDQSVQQVLLPASPPSGFARSPFAPHSRLLSLVFRLRITVPGPLRFRRLAVPQTSWNLLHYDPEVLSGQRFL